MKHTINTIYHGLGVMLICIGFLVCIGAGGNSDLGMDMSMVARIGLSGLAAMGCGVFLTWWRV